MTDASNPESRPNARALFEEFIDLDPETRRVWLAELRTADPDLATRILKLIEADADGEVPPGSWMELGSRLREADETKTVPGDAQPPELSNHDRTPDEGAPDIEGYKIDRLLGHGGMGEVWEAEQLGTRRKVALKVLAFHGRWKPASQKRFRREVELAARLDHPSIATVFDSGIDRGRFYYAMQFIPGQTLGAYLKKNRPGWEEVIRLLLHVTDAMSHAHGVGIVHRDLKPANIIIGSDGVPVIVDFGIAKGVAALEQEDVLTQTDGVVGTPGFMSPEQAMGDLENVGPASDVFSLGVILYLALTGEAPFGGTATRVLREILEVEPPHLRAIRPEIPADLEAVCERALAKDPKERYGDAGDLSDDLRRFLAGKPVKARLQSFRSTVMNWMKHPRRVRDAGFFNVFEAVAMIIWALPGGIIMWLRGDEGMMPYIALGATLAAPAFLYVGFATVRARAWAVYVGFFTKAIALAAVLILSLAPRLIGIEAVSDFDDDRSGRIILTYARMVLTVGLFLHTAALTAFLANRRLVDWTTASRFG